MMGRLLCWLGLHDWRMVMRRHEPAIGRNPEFSAEEVEARELGDVEVQTWRCQRCSSTQVVRGN